MKLLFHGGGLASNKTESLSLAYNPPINRIYKYNKKPKKCKYVAVTVPVIGTASIVAGGGTANSTLGYLSSVGGSGTNYNMLGEKVFAVSLSPAGKETYIDMSNSASGIYLYRVLSETRNLVSEGKFIITK